DKLKAEPVPYLQEPLYSLVSALRFEPFLKGYDVKDAFFQVMLGPSLSSMCTLHFPDSTATTTKLMMFKYMPYGMTLSSLILDFCVTDTIKNLPIKNPNTKHIHYVDDLAQLAKSTDDFFDLNECTSPNGLPLTTEDILSEDKTTFYGVTLTD
ncbi:hypothetical protein FOZ63_024571, partial [Perkinsus olseni]